MGLTDAQLLRADATPGALPLPRTGEAERTAAMSGAITTSIEKVIQWGRYSSLFTASDESGDNPVPMK